MTRRPPKQKICKTDQATETVGEKPWAALAADAVKKYWRGAELIAMGAFTTQDFAGKTGWTYNKCKNYLRHLGLKSEVAQDRRIYRNPRLRFWFPPGKNKN